MTRFLLRRLFGSLVSVCGVSLLVFSLVHLVPGDPVDSMLGEGGDPRDKAALRACLDLDQPLPTQLARFFSHVADGSLGHTCHDPLHPRTVASLVAAAFPSTLALAAAAMTVAVAFALPLGVLAALRPGGVLDGASGVLALAAASMPSMWLGPLLLLAFYIRLGWLPGPADDPTGLGLVLPSLMLGTHLLAMLSRMTRSSLLDVLSEDYIRTARGKGLSSLRVVTRHALRNALLPVITVAGIQFGSLLAGAVVTEKVFARPGLGTLLLDAIAERDYRVVQGTALVIAVSYVLMNLLVDVVYGFVDPRIRLS